MSRLAAVSLLVLLVGCSDWRSAWGDTLDSLGDSSGAYQGPTVIDTVVIDCLVDQQQWVIDTYTIGWTAESRFTLHRWYPDHSETHGLAIHSRDDDGWWERQQQDLDIVPEDVVTRPGESTHLPCDYSFMTFRVQVVGVDGSSSDCVVLGYDPSVLDRGGRCEVLDIQP